jgi:RND family efflux transporter MFP subunit
MTLLVGKKVRFFAVFGVLIGLLACSHFAACKKAGGEKKKKQTQVIPVSVTEAAQRTLKKEVFLAGDIHADVSVKVLSLVPERIIELKFEEGDMVKKGQLLATVKAGSLYDAVRAAKAGLRAAKTQKKLAEIELKRTRKLFKSNTVPIAQLQRAEAQANSAKAQLSQAKAQLSSSYSNISNVTVRAPVSGIIGQRFLNEGDVAGPQIPLCTIVQLDKIRVKAMATEFDLVKLKKGQPARITVPAYKDKVWKGKVDYLSPVLDRSTRSAWVTVLVDNKDHRLRPGMFADVVVEVGSRPKVVMVPARAVKRRVQADGKIKHLVFLAKGDEAKAREVEIGTRKGDEIEIRSGLKVGAPVISLGSHRVKDGTKIEVNKSPLKDE